MYCRYSKKELKSPGIYQIKNLMNNKIYVGSSFNMQTRKREHELDLKKNDHRNGHLQNAYNKYGEDNFVFEVLEFLKPNDNQWEREQFWINELNVCDKNIGYNIQSEVLIVPKQTKAVVCLETKEIFNTIEDANKKYNLASGSISCCCNKRKLKQTGGYHWRFYDEYIQMTEDEIQEVIFDVKSYPFICLDDNKIYRSWRELPYKNGAISRCCNLLAKKEYATCHGKQYMFLKDYNNLTSEEVEQIKKLEPNTATSGEVICLENKKIYRCAREAALEMGIDSSSILNCCYEKALSAGNLHWRFKREYSKLSEEDVLKIINTKKDDKYVKSVICLETKVSYRSEADASRDTGISIHMINKMCNNKGINISKDTLHFVFTEDYEKLSESDILEILNKKAKHIRRVMCTETGQIFESVTEAAKYIKGETSNISKCCKDSKYICKGYHWQYI